MPRTIMRPNGGHLWHVVIAGRTALCGYQPSSPNGHMIRHRGRWADKSHGEPTCKKCLKKLEEEHG